MGFCNMLHSLGRQKEDIDDILQKIFSKSTRSEVLKMGFSWKVSVGPIIHCWSCQSLCFTVLDGAAQCIKLIFVDDVFLSHLYKLNSYRPSWELVSAINLTCVQDMMASSIYRPYNLTKNWIATGNGETHILKDMEWRHLSEVYWQDALGIWNSNIYIIFRRLPCYYSTIYEIQMRAKFTPRKQIKQTPSHIQPHWLANPSS